MGAFLKMKFSKASMLGSVKLPRVTAERLSRQTSFTQGKKVSMLNNGAPSDEKTSLDGSTYHR